MSFRPTTYSDVHDEFYYPGRLSARERRPIRQTGYDMGLRGARVTREFLDEQAKVYHGRLNSALHTIDQRAHVVRHRSGDWGRNLSLGVLAFGGLAILVLALTVDYKILHDFWTTIYQNKFLKVPESLKDNVAFKSLQVLFAVLAIHFLISAPGIVGKAVRGTFMVSIGVMVLAMLIGLGFLAAKSTIPPDATFNGKPVTASAVTSTVSNDRILQGLGLRPSSGTRADSAMDSAGPGAQDNGRKSGGTKWMSGAPKTGGNWWTQLKSVINSALDDPDSTGTVVFFATFSLIFLFVSSVGALCLHYSLKAFDALLGGVGAQHPEHKAPGLLHGVTYWALGKGEWRPKTSKDLGDERQRILHAQRLIGEPTYREHLMSKFFAEFSAGYMDGLQARQGRPRVMGAGYDELRDEMRGEIGVARSEWSAEAIAELMPETELRRSLGYNPDARLPGGGGNFGFVSKLIGGGRARDGGHLHGEDRTNDEAARLPGPGAA
jgi:hypothetical protein